MTPSCPHCEKKFPAFLLLNIKNLKECPNCKKAITPKLNWARGLGFGAVALLIAVIIAFTLFGPGKFVHILGAIAGFLGFTIFGYSFEKKD